MSYSVFAKGKFIPSVCLRPGENVFDLDGYCTVVEVVGFGYWFGIDGMRREGGAIEALDVTDHPVVQCELVDFLKEKGAL